MPSPSINQVHTNVPLSNISIQMLNESDGFIATKVFPAVNVKNKADDFVTYDRAAKNTRKMKVRAPGTESVGGGWSYGSDTYSCKVYAYHVDLDDQTVDNADSFYDLQSEAAEEVAHQALLQREFDFLAAFYKTGVWSMEYRGIANDTIPADTAATANRGIIRRFEAFNRAGSTPFIMFKEIMREQKLRSGYTPNTLVLSQHIFDTLADHPDYLDRVTNGQTSGYEGTELKMKELANHIGVNRIFIASAVEWDGEETTTSFDSNNAFDAANHNTYMADQDSMLFLYVSPKKLGLRTVSAGCTFEWTGYRGAVSNGAKVKSFRMEHIESERVEISLAYAMKVLAKDCGTYVFDCTTDSTS